MHSKPFDLRQSIVEVLSIFCITVIATFLLSLIIFISVQGVRYFSPSKVYEVSLRYPDASQQTYFQQEHSSAENFARDLRARLSLQYSDSQGQKPEVQVKEIDKVAEITTTLGKRYFGVVKELRSDKSSDLPFSELENLLLTVELLKTQLRDTQTNQLAPLHRQISVLEQQGVQRESPALQSLLTDFSRWQTYVDSINDRLQQYQIVLEGADQTTIFIALNNLDDLIFPNNLSWIETMVVTFERLWAFLSERPKQGATAGGVFPAIFGTMLMVILMTIIVAPFGMIAAVYLHEYAPDNKLTSLIRVGVSNMAAVPSVVYGVFGLGFFVYTLGGSIDQLLFSDNLPSPTFGTPGLLWASLTMGLLTLPVVIVAAEEGLARVPRGQREGAYALGATKLETILKVVLPMASPGMLTGIILAIARAAGEVAPLILVGAVKFAPSLPVDADFPYLHLERQFMHLGAFIYDGAFHSQVDNKASSMMFASCMLLLMIVFILNIGAVVFRKRLKDRYERSLL